MTGPGEVKRVPLRIKLPFATADEFITRYGANVAAGGLFVATRSTRPEGTPVSFELVLADGTRLMRGEGAVQKVVPEAEPGRAGMLVRFTRIDAQTKALLDRVLAARAGVPAPQDPPLEPSPPLPPPAPLPAPERAGAAFTPVELPATSPSGLRSVAALPPTSSHSGVSGLGKTPPLGARPVTGSTAAFTSEPTKTPALGTRGPGGGYAPSPSPVPSSTPPLPPRGTASIATAVPSSTPPLPPRGSTPGPAPAPERTPPLPAPPTPAVEPLVTPALPVRAVAPPPSRPTVPTEPGLPMATVSVPAGEEIVLGIDLGTTTCRVAVFVDGAPRLVPITSERGIALPSVVAFDKVRQKLLVGSPARRYAVDFPDQSAVGFKRLIGRRARSKKVQELAKRFAYPIVADPEGDAGVELGGHVFGIPELSAQLLLELKNAAQEYVGKTVNRAVLCVPAWCNDYQRGAVLEAGRRAGLSVMRVLNEPSAVALAFGHGKGLARKRVLVYDLGGGTFDASVVEITGDDIEVVSTGGDAFLGGLDFDYRLAEALVGAMPERPRERLIQSRMGVERVRDACENAKIALSERELAQVNVPFATTDDAGNPMDLKSDVRRDFLEQNTSDLVERTVLVTRVVLEAARLSPQALDEVLVVGGQSRAPAVRRALEAFLGKPVRTDVDAQGAVALGAAVLGRSLVQQERGRKGALLSEVLSAPIGIAVRGGGIRRVLERNTRLPADKTLAVPVKQGQPTRIAVFQGTAEQAEDNEYLGALQLVGDRTGDVEVRFAVSPDGRLALSATAPGGKPCDAAFTTADASDAVRTALLAEAPLPFQEPEAGGTKGLLGGFKRLFNR